MALASSPLPPLTYLDYPVNVHLRVYRNGSRYGADLFAEGQPRRLAIDLSPDDLAAINQQLQESIQELARALEASGDDAEATAGLFLRPLAELGRYSFQEVFGRADDAQFVEDLLAQERCSLQVASEDFFLPWELLYPRDVGRSLSYDFFVGMNHLVSRVIVQDGPAGPFVSPVIRAGPQPSLGLLTDEGLPAVAQHERPFFERLAKEGKIALYKLRALDPRNRLQELTEFKEFWGKGLHLAHVACEAAYEDRFPNRSRILLSDDFAVSVQDLEVYGVALSGHPLIILNACKTGNVNPRYTAHFARVFLKNGARGVVGTECEVPDRFAAAFAQQLYLHLLAGRTLGESILAARQFFLTRGNPSGLLYSMYAPPSVRLALGPPPEPAAPEPVQASSRKG